jgi:hypothetical protein
MNVLYNDPGLQVLTWRLEERALLARLEIRRQLGPWPSEAARFSRALLQTVGAFLMRCGQWLTAPHVDFAARRSTSM